MGSSSSKEQTAPPRAAEPRRLSTDEIVQSNLLYCLRETTQWEDRSVLLNELLASSAVIATAYSRQSVQNVLYSIDQLIQSGGHTRWQRMVRETAERARQEELQRQQAQQSQQSNKKSNKHQKSKSADIPNRVQAQSSSALARGGNGNGDRTGSASAGNSRRSSMINSNGIEKNELLARGLIHHLYPLPVSASEIFGSAAAEVVSTAPVYNDEYDASVQPSTHQRTNSNHNVNATSNNLSTYQANTSELSLNIPFDCENEKKNVAVKYLFIHTILEKLSSSAAYSYKLLCKIQNYDQQLEQYTQREQQKQPQPQTNSSSQQPKQQSSSNQSVQPSATVAPAYATAQTGKIQTIAHAELDRNRSHCIDQLRLAMKNFDKARSTVEWMYRDYDLTYAAFNLRYQLAVLKQSRDRSRDMSEQVSGSGEIDSAYNQLEQARSLLELEFQANERSALSIGLMYLDRNNSGALEPEEVAEMSAVMYRAIDRRDKHAVTASDLQESITSYCSKLDIDYTNLMSAQREIDQLQSRGDNTTQQVAVRIMNIQSQIPTITLRYNDNKALIRGIYNYFHTSFLKYVFNKLTVDCVASDIDNNVIMTNLQALQQLAWLDPLEYGVNADSDREYGEKLAAEAELRLRERNVSTLAATDVLSHMLSNTTFNSQQQINASQRGTSRAYSRAPTARSVADIQSINGDNEPYQQPMVTLTPNHQTNNTNINTNTSTPITQVSTQDKTSYDNASAAVMSATPNAIDTTQHNIQSQPDDECVEQVPATSTPVKPSTDDNADNTTENDHNGVENNTVTDVPAPIDQTNTEQTTAPSKGYGLGSSYSYNDIDQDKLARTYAQHHEIISDLP